MRIRKQMQGSGLYVRNHPNAQVNVSDDDEDWTRNYRCPDIAVFLEGTAGEDRGTHWYGGPDFAVEIVSKNDLSREKIEFYESTGTRELLIVDRFPWQLELFRLNDGKLISVGTSTVPDGGTLTSNVMPFSFRLDSGYSRPVIAVSHSESEKQWRV